MEKVKKGKFGDFGLKTKIFAKFQFNYGFFAHKKSQFLGFFENKYLDLNIQGKMVKTVEHVAFQARRFALIYILLLQFNFI